MATYDCDMLSWTGEGGKLGWSARCTDALHETPILGSQEEASDALAAHILVGDDTADDFRLWF